MNLKRVISIIGISTLSFGLMGCGTTSESKIDDTNWEVVRTVNNTKANANHIGGFLNENFGLTVGYRGEMHYTTDGGDSWPAGTNESLCRYGLNILNENLAWSCGNGGDVRKTTDGGKTWVEVTDFGDNMPNQCRYLSFLDENTGWIAAPKKLGSTSDGGQTWLTLSLPSDIKDIIAIDLLDKNTGYLVDTNSKLYLTNDGGLTWTNKTINIDNLPNSTWSTNLSLIRFTDKDNGTIFYYGSEKKLKCSITKDAGDTWEEQTMPDIKGLGLFLTPDGKYLSVNGSSGESITLLKQK